MIHQRLPDVAHTIVESLDGRREVGGCLGELRAVTTVLDTQGFIGRPSWVELRGGCRPPPANFVELGEWPHGWQFASSVSELHFRKTVVLAQSCPSHQAHLRSHSGGGSSNVLHGCPTKPEFAVEPNLFRNLILERLKLPLAVTDATCECGAPWTVGKGRAACSQSGRLHTRAVAPEKTLARVCREAGAIVRTNVKNRDMNIAVRADDERCIEVVAVRPPSVPCAQLAVDITLRCAFTSRGEPRERPSRQSSEVRGVARWGSLSARCGCAGDWRTVEHRSTGVRGVSSVVPGKRPHPHWHDLYSSLGGEGGLACCPSRVQERSPPL